MNEGAAALRTNSEHVSDVASVVFRLSVSFLAYADIFRFQKGAKGL